MNFLATNYCRAMARIAVFAMLALVAGHSMAGDYNIILKDQNDSPVQCAIGGFTDPATEFSFNKTAAGNFAVSGLSVTVAANCISGIVDSQTFDKDSSVAVQVRESVLLNKPGTGCSPPDYNQPGCKLEDLQQGPNVQGLGGFTTGSEGSISTKLSNQYPRYRLTFKYDENVSPAARTYKIELLSIANRVETVALISEGKYYVRNTANPIPEPETLLLLMVGLGAMGVIVRRWRR